MALCSLTFGNMRVVSWDVGHKNLATVVAEVSFGEDGEVDVVVVDCLMTNLKHIACNDSKCMFMKTDNSAAHRVYHFIQSLRPHLEIADLICMESQPPVGLTAVEHSLYIYSKLWFSRGDPERVKLFSPNAMHAVFKMSHAKAQRRIEAVELTTRYLSGHEAFDCAVEKDHLADACLYILYYVKDVHHRRTKRAVNPFRKFAYMNDTRACQTRKR